MDEENVNQNLENEDEEVEELTSVGELPKEIYFCDPIFLEDTKTLVENTQFKEGLNSAAFYCGFYTACINTGMRNTEALEVLLTHLNYELSLKLGKMNNDTAKETSKITQINNSNGITADISLGKQTAIQNGFALEF
jgi:hypothetical protein